MNFTVLIKRLTMNLQLTLLLAYDVFPVILQKLRPPGVLFSKEQCVKIFTLHIKKWWWLSQKWWWHVTTVTYKVVPMLKVGPVQSVQLVSSTKDWLHEWLTYWLTYKETEFIICPVLLKIYITGWALAQTCCISHISGYRKWQISTPWSR